MLALDARSVPAKDLSMNTLTRELNLAAKPNWLLLQMMRHLEKKRSAKGLGWSRPWNKGGLKTFRTHKNYQDDESYYEGIQAFLEELRPLLPQEAQDFLTELWDDPARMGFTFYHNREDDQGVEFEGLTISLGRKLNEDRTRRDRFDIVLEDQRREGSVDGQVDVLRVYSAPWTTWENRQTQYLARRDSELDGELGKSAQALYDLACRFYETWKDDEPRQWSHWSNQYIDYFGARAFIPVGSRFL